MKAITIREPWATLIAIGAKRIETRSWPAPHWLFGQTIAIHAAKGMDEWEYETCFELPFCDVLAEAGIRVDARIARASTFLDTRGCVIATATLKACRRIPHPITQEHLTAKGFPAHELDFGDFTPGRYGWILEDVRAPVIPIPARGAQGLWDWDDREAAA